MHVQDYLLTSTVDGILAQRLVRRLCPHCREAYTPDAAWVREVGLEAVSGQAQPTLYRAKGCEHCEYSGYWGRITILELLVMTESVRRAVLEQSDAETIRSAALADGMRPMRDDGLRKAQLGLTTVEEVERVTQETEHAVV
jgi:general secretion pathway protein E